MKKVCSVQCCPAPKLGRRLITCLVVPRKRAANQHVMFYTAEAVPHVSEYRELRHWCLATGVADVERHAVGALQALTVKLSERAFKPLFLRLIDWARATLPPGDALLLLCLHDS